MDFESIKRLGLDHYNIDLTKSYEIYNPSTNNHTIHLYLLKDKTIVCQNCGSIDISIKGSVKSSINYSSPLENNITIILHKRQYRCNDCNKTFYQSNPIISEGKNISIQKDFNISPTYVQNLFDTIQAVNNLYDCIVLVEPYYDIDTNKYKLQFAVRRNTTEINIKLSDYDVKMSLSQNITNQVICTDKTQSITYYLYNDNTIGTEFDSQKSLMPPRIETIEKDPSDYDEDSESTPFKDACIEGMELLLNNRYKDKVTIDLNTKLGSTLKNVDLTYSANITEYNPADPDSTKRLPVMSVKEDSKGNKQLSFGRLSDYWFMEEK